MPSIQREAIDILTIILLANAANLISEHSILVLMTIMEKTFTMADNLIQNLFPLEK